MLTLVIFIGMEIWFYRHQPVIMQWITERVCIIDCAHMTIFLAILRTVSLPVCFSSAKCRWKLVGEELLTRLKSMDCRLSLSAKLVDLTRWDWIQILTVFFVQLFRLVPWSIIIFTPVFSPRVRIWFYYRLSRNTS